MIFVSFVVLIVLFQWDTFVERGLISCDGPVRQVFVTEKMKDSLNQNEEVAAIKASMSELAADAGTILERAAGAFRSSRLEEIRDMGPSSSRARVTECGLINSVLALRRVDDAEKKALIGAIGHLERICVFSAELAGVVRLKIERDILFSVQAFGECNELIAEAIETVNSLGLFIEGGIERAELDRLCRGLERHIYESEMGHEERLIKGVCAVKASELFTGMLDLFRATAFHSSRAADSLGRW